MTKKISLNAKTRSEKTKNPKRLREKGIIPVVLYGGKDVKNQNIEVKLLDFERAYSEAGESSLLDLVIDGKEPVKVIVKDVQKNPVKDVIIHADLYQVDMKNKIQTEIPLKFVGESEAVNVHGGFLIKSFDFIEVECLPGDLVSFIEVDISSLKNLNDSIQLSDIKLPEGIVPEGDLNDQIVSVIEPRKEEEKEEKTSEEVEEKKEEEKGEAGEAEEKKEE
jgi:large subunit ribosomal protein L25